MDTAVQGMRWELICRSGGEAEAEVGTPTWGIPGGLTSGADAEVINRAASWATDMSIITAAARFTGAEATI